MSETGYKQEVARLRTTSTFVKVYDLIFEDILKEMVTKDDVDIEGIDHDLEVKKREKTIEYICMY